MLHQKNFYCLWFCSAGNCGKINQFLLNFFLIFAFFSYFTMETGILSPKFCSENAAEIFLYIANRVCVCLCILIIFK